MDQEIAEAIVEQAKDAGYEVSLYEGYSGRGMYGKETTAIKYESEGELLECIVLAAIDIEAGVTSFQCNLQDFLKELRAMRRDNLGRSTLLIY